MAAPILAAVLALALAAGPVPVDEREPLEARIYDTVGLPEDQRETMLRVAGDALALAGIQMTWKRCLDATGNDCPSPHGRDTVVRILERHGGAESGRCGYAMAEAGRGFVSLSRHCAERALGSLSRRWMPLDLQPLTNGEVLGYMLAHEMAHVLLPGVEHSRHGLFKARLHARDWRTVRRSGLAFTPADAERLRASAAILRAKVRGEVDLGVTGDRECHHGLRSRASTLAPDRAELPLDFAVPSDERWPASCR